MPPPGMISSVTTSIPLRSCATSCPGANKPALGVVAHTRKPHPNEKRTGGTGLMHILSGSYVLTSVPRSIFVMIRGSQDEDDNSVVWCNPKNSNGPLQSRSAWERRADGFVTLADFDWDEFDQPPESRIKITVDHIREVFAESSELRLGDAVQKLVDLTGVKRGSAYNALNKKFREHLQRNNGSLRFIP